MSFLLTVLRISTVYTSGWFEVMSWSWTKILINSGEQSDRLSYPLLDLWLVKLFLVFFNGLWSWAKFISPTLGGNLSITLSYLLFFPPHRHVMQDHRGIEKIVEATCSHVSHLSTSTLESRDEIPVRGVNL